MFWGRRVGMIALIQVTMMGVIYRLDFGQKTCNGAFLPFTR
jgi:hypothetical protein